MGYGLRQSRPGHSGEEGKPGAVADRKLRAPGWLRDDGGALDGRRASGRERSRGAVPSPPPAGRASARPGGGTDGAEAEFASAVRARFSGEARSEPPAASCGSDAVRGTPWPPCTLPCRPERSTVVACRLRGLRSELCSCDQGVQCGMRWSLQHEPAAAREAGFHKPHFGWPMCFI
jgi:hypothetical protein